MRPRTRSPEQRLRSLIACRPERRTLLVYAPTGATARIIKWVRDLYRFEVDLPDAGFCGRSDSLASNVAAVTTFESTGDLPSLFRLPDYLRL